MRHLPLIAVLLSPAPALAANPPAKQPLTTLFDFRTRDNGKGTDGGLIADGAGNLYGTTAEGGLYNRGTVFELMPPVAGRKAWTETILVNFNDADGHYPSGTLLRDSAGDLYGTTRLGGPDQGVVFELTPPAGGQTSWTETILVSFHGVNGLYPSGGLVADKAGNLYGTTANGDPAEGLVFELSPPKSGQTAWTETILFGFNGTNGASPDGNLIFDKAGNLYGTTSGGGEDGLGTVFELSPPVSGQTAWTEAVLVSFNGQNGGFPEAGVVADKTGNLYATTAQGGTDGYGCVVELTPPAPGQNAWTEHVLLSFNGADGATPLGNMILDKAGNLYGTTSEEGAAGFGNVFELTKPAPGQTGWSETVLADFDGLDGSRPLGGLIADKAGNLYGTTGAGSGKSRYGSVFRLKR